ncbi:HD domain-containing protein [bacterium]|nr:HD domain-containing protein [bacterium]
MFDTETVYEVVVFSIGDTKAGSKMGKLQLKAPDESLLNCILWEETLNRMDEKLFRTGNKLRIVSGSFNEKYNNCLVSVLELIEEAKLGIDEAEQEKLFRKIISCVEKFENQQLKDFLLNLLNDNKELLKITPAAKLMHHNYVGGLLVHTNECMDLAEKAFDFVTNLRISKDEVLAACILHDFGKIYEYVINTETGLIEYNEEFRKDWITHSQYGFALCMSNGFKNIAKMIAAHHSRAEWGAMIDLNEKNLESFVYLLHHIDDMSAKFGRINISLLK